MFAEIISQIDHLVFKVNVLQYTLLFVSLCYTIAIYIISKR